MGLPDTTLTEHPETTIALTTEIGVHKNFIYKRKYREYFRECNG